jgi:2-succinyl-5-enolpyruvyl-6-hydroxy-3-cyclohexene-1-carboxylate synthase
MNGLWAIRRHAITARLVVLDNGGGGIFEFLPPSRHRDVFEEVFATPLDLDLRHVAELYGIPYRLVETVAALEEALAATRTGMIHVRFSREASVAGHRRAWDAVASALG